MLLWACYHPIILSRLFSFIQKYTNPDQIKSIVKLRLIQLNAKSDPDKKQCKIKKNINYLEYSILSSVESSRSAFHHRKSQTSKFITYCFILSPAVATSNEFNREEKLIILINSFSRPFYRPILGPGLSSSAIGFLWCSLCQSNQ